MHVLHIVDVHIHTCTSTHTFCDTHFLSHLSSPPSPSILLNTDWTLPHCVLTLRLIGLTWDYYDGDVSQLTPNQMADRRLNAVVAQPTLIEVLGFAYFFPAYLAGPQFTLRSYRAFVAGDGYDYVNGRRSVYEVCV